MTAALAEVRETVAAKAPGTRARGGARLAFRAGDGPEGHARLAALHQESPLRVLLPRPRAGDLATAVMATTSGGLVGGDSLDIEVAIGARARALVVPQAAEKIYGQSREAVTWRSRMTVADGGWLEALPMATIFFQGARLTRSTAVELEGEAAAMTGDLLILGRLAHGERFTSGALDDLWSVRRDGRLLWADRLDLGPEPAAALAHPAGLGGLAALGSLIYCGPEAEALLPVARETEPREGVKLAAGLLEGGVLLVRLFSDEPWALRMTYENLWCRLRARAAGLPARLPAVWHC